MKTFATVRAVDGMNRGITFSVITTFLAVLLAACASNINQQDESVPAEAAPGMTEAVPGAANPHNPLDETK